MTTTIPASGATVTESSDMLPLGQTCDRCIQHASVVAQIGSSALQFCRHHYRETMAGLHEQSSAIHLFKVRAD